MPKSQRRGGESRTTGAVTRRAARDSTSNQRVKRGAAFKAWLGDRLRGISVDPTTLAAKAGISRTYLSMLMSGERAPSYRVVWGLAKALDTDFPAALAAAGLAVQDASTSSLTQTDSSRRNEGPTDEVSERGIIFDIALLPPGLTVEQLLCRILDKVAELIAFDFGNITLVDWEDRKIHVLAHRISGKPAVYGKSEFTPTSWEVTQGITGQVAQLVLPVRIADVSAVGQQYLRHSPTTNSELAVPLQLQNTVIGVLNLESDQLDHFSDRDESLLMMIAPYLATAVGHARTHAALQEWHARFTALARLHGNLLRSRDEAALLQDLARGIATFRPFFDMCVVRSHDAEKGYLLLRGAAHRQAKLRLDQVGLRIPVNHSMSGEAVRQFTSMRYRDIANDSRFYMRELADLLGLHGMVAVPIPAPDLHKPPIGCISVYSTSTDYRFQEEHVRLLEDIASFASVAISNRQAHSQLSAYRAASEICRHGIRGSETFDRICELVCEHIGSRGASLLILNDLDDRLCLVGSTGIKGVTGNYGSVAYGLGEGKTGWIAAHGKPVRLVARDGSPEDRQIELTGYAGLTEAHKYAEDVLPGVDQRTLCFLGVPILSGNRVVGVIRATGRMDGLDFTPADQTILETVPFEVGAALQGHKIRGDSTVRELPLSRA